MFWSSDTSSSPANVPSLHSLPVPAGLALSLPYASPTQHPSPCTSHYLSPCTAPAPAPSPLPQCRRSSGKRDHAHRSVLLESLFLSWFHSFLSSFRTPRSLANHLPPPLPARLSSSRPPLLFCVCLPVFVTFIATSARSFISLSAHSFIFFFCHFTCCTCSVTSTSTS